MSTKRKPSREVPSHALPPLGKQLLMRQTPTIESIDENNEQIEMNANGPYSLSDIPPPPPSSYPTTHEIIYADQVLRTNASSIPPMSDPLRILNTPPNMSVSSTDSTVSEASIPKDLRPAQPHDEREYFERLWAKNFELSEAEAVKSKQTFADDYIPVGKKAELLQISGYTLAKDPDNGKLYTVFRLELSCKANEKRWTVYRRYDDIKALYSQLKAEGYHIPPLPAKSILRTFSKEFLKKRQADLQEWLHQLLNPTKHSNSGLQFVADIHDSDTLRHFLTHLANHPPKLEEPSPSTSINNTKSSSCPNFLSNHRNTFSSTFSLSHSHSSSMSSGTESSPAPSKSKTVNDDTTDTTAQQEKNKLSVDDFEFIRVVGKGSFGKVLLVKKKVSGELYAMKILSKPTVIKKKQVEHTCTERRVLANVSHPFIVALHYAFQTPTKLYFVLDYCPGGDIFFHLSKYGCFPEIMAKFYCAEIVLALIHLHSLGIVYRDLKPENIMLDVDGHIKLADFGLAKEGITDTVNGTNTMCGTPEYLPPEILNRNGHGIAVDWWNLGMVLYEMLTGRPPWYTTDRMKLFLRLRKAELQFVPGMSEESMSFISALLTREPELRLGSQSPEEILRHPFFYGINWQEIYNKEITPPFQPCQYSDPLEATNFEDTFTQMSIHDDNNTEDDEAEGEPLPEKNKDYNRRGSQLRAQSHKSYTFWNFTYEGRDDDMFRQ